MLKIKVAKPTGGKAGKGHNKTSTVQILDMECSTILKQFRFYVKDTVSKLKAFKKAKAFVLGLK